MMENTGKIRLLEQSEIETINGQTSLFGGLIPARQEAQLKTGSRIEESAGNCPA